MFAASLLRSFVSMTALLLTMTLAFVCLPHDATAQESSEEWIELFDGKTLAGWQQHNGWATYRVEDGAIVGKTAEGSPNSFLCTMMFHGDFELTFDVLVDEGLNSGVQIRSHSKPDYRDGRLHGPQVEIESSPGNSGFIYGEGTDRGWISAEPKPHEWMKNGQWNTFRVVAEGPRFRTWINGHAVEDVTDEQSPKCGMICLQVHGVGRGQGPYEVRWRNIKLRKISGGAASE